MERVYFYNTKRTKKDGSESVYDLRVKYNAQ